MRDAAGGKGKVKVRSAVCEDGALFFGRPFRSLVIYGNQLGTIVVVSGVTKEDKARGAEGLEAGAPSDDTRAIRAVFLCAAQYEIYLVWQSKRYLRRGFYL